MSATVLDVVRRATRSPGQPSVLPVEATDEWLVRRVAERRDAEAFAVLYQRYARAVHSLVCRLAGDEADTTVVADIFAAVWETVGHKPFDGTPATEAIPRIVRGAVADAVPDRPGDTSADAALRSFVVHVAVDALPDDERQVIELLFYRQLSERGPPRSFACLSARCNRRQAALRLMASRLSMEQQHD